MIELIFIYSVLLYYHIWWAIGVCLFLNGIAVVMHMNDNNE